MVEVVVVVVVVETGPMGDIGQSPNISNALTSRDSWFGVDCINENSLPFVRGVVGFNVEGGGGVVGFEVGGGGGGVGVRFLVSRVVFSGEIGSTSSMRSIGGVVSIKTTASDNSLREFSCMTGSSIDISSVGSGSLCFVSVAGEGILLLLLLDS